MVISCTCKVEK